MAPFRTPPDTTNTSVASSMIIGGLLNFQIYLFTISSSFIVLVFMYMGIWYHVVQTRKQIVAVLAHQTKTNAKRLGGKLSLKLFTKNVKTSYLL
jgi:hypothetical protein